jgi:hypothetical protein
MDLIYLWTGFVLVWGAIGFVAVLAAYLGFYYVLAFIQAYRMNYWSRRLNPDKGYKPIWMRPDHWFGLAWLNFGNAGSEIRIRTANGSFFPIPLNPLKPCGWSDEEDDDD